MNKAIIITARVSYLDGSDCKLEYTTYHNDIGFSKQSKILTSEAIQDLKSEYISLYDVIDDMTCWNDIEKVVFDFELFTEKQISDLYSHFFDPNRLILSDKISMEIERKASELLISLKREEKLNKLGI